jgi:phosphoribosyl 1,2-cyclic phosphate phosphodiesterase
MRVTLLGCGTSGGVPRLGNRWGACDPTDPRNRRRRVSVLVESATTTILIDTSPDLREQLLDAAVDRLDAVFWTHDHADHTHGIDDLRALLHLTGKPVPGYADPLTLEVLRQRFAYVFEGQHGYPAIVAPNSFGVGPVMIGDLLVQPFRQHHGPIDSWGFRIGGFAYSTDVNGFPPESHSFLRDLDLWIVDALRHEPHPTHPHLAQTLGWIESYRPRRAILTHMDHSMDFESLAASLPAGVEPGYDGQVVVL